jgi:hypothetical protein
MEHGRSHCTCMIRFGRALLQHAPARQCWLAVCRWRADLLTCEVRLSRKGQSSSAYALFPAACPSVCRRQCQHPTGSAVAQRPGDHRGIQQPGSVSVFQFAGVHRNDVEHPNRPCCVECFQVSRASRWCCFLSADGAWRRYDRLLSAAAAGTEKFSVLGDGTATVTAGLTVAGPSVFTGDVTVR